MARGNHNARPADYELDCVRAYSGEPVRDERLYVPPEVLSRNARL